MSRWLLVAACVLAVVGSGGGLTAATAPEPPDTTPAGENVFLPDEEQLSECISALPPPTCGSESRGGWPQVLIAVAIAVGLIFIMWRIIRATRRRTP